MKAPRTLLQRAVALLARRDYSRIELRRRLRRLLPPDDDGAGLEPVLDTLERRGLLSDRRFAAGLARTRAPRFGVRRLRDELHARGVQGDLAAAALAPLAATEVERARSLYQRRYPAPADSFAERARRQRFLAARGFSFDTIRQVLGRHHSDDDTPPSDDA